MQYITAYFSLLREAYNDILHSLQSDTAHGFMLAAVLLVPVFGALFFFTVLVNANEITTPIQATPRTEATEFSPTTHRDNMTITYVSDEAVVQAKLDAYFAETGRSGRALSTWNESECTIYALEPQTKKDMEILGHETAHCFRGEYHR